MEQKGLLRSLPKVDVLAEAAGKKWNLPESGAVRSCRNVISLLRTEILDGKRESLPDQEELMRMVYEDYRKNKTRSLRPVINATGIILHTNLGRSILSEEAAVAAKEAAESYSTLEFNLKEGKRGSRHDHVEELLKTLCQGEAAMVVNNNAAAVMLLLNTVAKEHSVVLSRGEMVEIGGSFRVPEIMEMSGCRLKEVGTTNKTHLFDYERAIDEDTAALLKVHTSNFRMLGFTESVSLSELSDLAHKRGLPVIYDMGSGFLEIKNGLKGVDEPSVKQALKDGADLVSFSGDKLLGGPQAGIIVGRKKYIDAMKKNPLARVVRVDKMTLAALEVTLRQYLEGNAGETLPTLEMLTASEEELYERASALSQKLGAIEGVSCKVIRSEAPAGGGSIPEVMFPTCCVAVQMNGYTAGELEWALRMLPVPIVARIHDGEVWLDVKTVQKKEMTFLEEGIRSLSTAG